MPLRFAVRGMHARLRPGAVHLRGVVVGRRGLSTTPDERRGLSTMADEISRGLSTTPPDARMDFLDELHDYVTRRDLRVMATALSLPASSYAETVDAAVARRTEAALRGQEYTLVTVDSSPLGGLGVFAARDLPKGSVVALYPGRVCSPAAMRGFMANVRNALRAHAHSLYDRLARDGSAPTLADDWSNPYAMMASDGHFYDPVGYGGCEGLGIGHRFNHPPRNMSATILSWPTTVTDPVLRKKLPNDAVGGDTDACLSMLTVADVNAGDELFMDYRYELGLDDEERAQLPAWYASVPSNAPRWNSPPGQ